MADWYVAIVEPSAEGIVSRRAGELGIEAYAPSGKRLVRTRFRNRIELVARSYPVMPGYVFVRGGCPAQYRRDWERPDSIPHCLGLLGVDGPEPVSDHVIEALREREAAGEFDGVMKTGRYWAPRWLRSGRAVRIIDGPFRGASGRVWKLTARQTVMLWLLVMGRETLAEVALDAIARAR